MPRPTTRIRRLAGQRATVSRPRPIQDRPRTRTALTYVRPVATLIVAAVLGLITVQLVSPSGELDGLASTEDPLSQPHVILRLAGYGPGSTPVSMYHSFDMTSIEGAQSRGYELLRVYVHGLALSGTGEIELYAEELWGSAQQEDASCCGAARRSVAGYLGGPRSHHLAFEA